MTSLNSGIVCQSRDTSGLDRLTGYLDAVAISGELDSGVQVCFRAAGSLIYMDTAASLPRLMELLSYGVSGMTSGWIDRPGMVVLMASVIPLSYDTGSDSAIPLRLQDCNVTTTARLNFRNAPDGSDSIAVIPEGLTWMASARSGDWFNVRYQETLGWISADFVDVRGRCS